MCLFRFACRWVEQVEARRRTTVENIRVEELDRLTNTVTKPVVPRKETA